MPEMQRTPEPAYVPRPSSGPPPPPGDSRLLYLTGRFSDAVTTQRRVTFGISVMLFVVLFLRQHLKLSLEFGGIKIESLGPERDFAVLITSLALARLTVVMADVARLANTLKTGVDFYTTDFNRDDKEVAAVEVGDEEAGLGGNYGLKSSHPASYFLYRLTMVLQKILYKILLFGIVTATFISLGLGIRDLIGDHALRSPAWQVVLALTILFVTQSILSIGQLLILRRVRD
jgi:hypothetical protein